MKPDQFRIAPEYVEAFLARHRIRWDQIERGAPVWPSEAHGLIPLSPEDLERLIAVEDPAVWAWLYLSERLTVLDEETNEPIVRRGDPWSLFPIQADLARTGGNLIVECGAEVGKTRDITLQILRMVDIGRPGDSGLIGVNLDTTSQEIWAEIEYQIEANPLIGGGLKSSRVKPYREQIFNNDCRFEMRLCGFDGTQFRGGHFNKLLTADEAAKWKNERQWSEFWRAALPGATFRIYSTPDGDYSSPFKGLSDRAIPLNGPDAEAGARARDAANPDEPRFRKFHISKRQLPPPFWTEKRAAKLRERFKGEHTTGWRNNVEGTWGAPESSIFPMHILRPNLAFLRDYRIVVAILDREKGMTDFRAARLSDELDSVEGGRQEIILAQELNPFVNSKTLAEKIARFFPDVVDLKAPKLYCGADLGSAEDPSEFVFLRVHTPVDPNATGAKKIVGQKWTDLFRLHLAFADWPVQAAVVAYLDHASGHQVKYGFDNGSAGSALAQVLQQMVEFRTCPVCACPVYFNERLKVFGFGNQTDEIDVETGKPILDPDRRDAKGESQPFRLSNKEFSTRVLERKAQIAELAIAWDGGAGHQKLSAPQLMMNHTSKGETSKKGERQFKKTDDHHVDARRQAALLIVSELRGDDFVSPKASMIAVGASRPATTRVFESGAGHIASAFGPPGGIARGWGL
ncbi:MAG: hypothetical protein M3167_05995 [Acidobacteriota bacterium]|nr:hypothetical protein [Acidobacteriota bacterium]